MLRKPMQVFARQRPIGNDAQVAGTVADFPGFSDWHAGRQRFAVKLGQPPPAPDPLLENRMKGHRVKHGSAILRGSGPAGNRKWIPQVNNFRWTCPAVSQGGLAWYSQTASGPTLGNQLGAI